MEPLTRLTSLAEQTTDLEWEECPCPLCGSGNWAPLIEAADASQVDGLRFLVVRCEQCGLCFTNPRPSPRSIDLFYPDDYPPFQHQSPARPGPWWHGLLRRVKGRQDLDKLLGRTAPGRLLDFGSGSGSFLARMQQRGWQVTGLDLSSSAVDRGRQLGLNVLHGSLPHEGLAEGSFDLVTMWQALEHVHQPLEVLRAARGLLAPDGRLVLSVPNLGSLPFRWFGPAWYGLDLPRHLTHFTPGTLRVMLRQAGFRPGRIRMLRSSAWLRHSLAMARRLQGEPSRWARWAGGRCTSGMASWLCYLTGLADQMFVTAQPAD